MQQAEEQPGGKTSPMNRLKLKRTMGSFQQPGSEIVKFDWANKWLKGDEYAFMLNNIEAYAQKFGLMKLPRKTHPETIYTNPENGMVYFVEGHSVGSEFGFPRVDLKKRYRWKKMNFTTELPKKRPYVTYIVASAVKCEKFFPNSKHEGPSFRMHAVILNNRYKQLSGREQQREYILCHIRKIDQNYKIKGGGGGGGGGACGMRGFVGAGRARYRDGANDFGGHHSLQHQLGRKKMRYSDSEYSDTTKMDDDDDDEGLENDEDDVDDVDDLDCDEEDDGDQDDDDDDEQDQEERRLHAAAADAEQGEYAYNAQQSYNEDAENMQAPSIRHDRVAQHHFNRHLREQQYADYQEQQQRSVENYQRNRYLTLDGGDLQQQQGHQKMRQAMLETTYKNGHKFKARHDEGELDCRDPSTRKKTQSSNHNHHQQQQQHNSYYGKDVSHFDLKLTQFREVPLYSLQQLSHYSGVLSHIYHQTVREAAQLYFTDGTMKGVEVLQSSDQDPLAPSKQRCQVRTELLSNAIFSDTLPDYRQLFNSLSTVAAPEKQSVEHSD